jgi:hypothetical protein
MRLKVAMWPRPAATLALPILHSTVGVAFIWSTVRKGPGVGSRLLQYSSFLFQKRAILLSRNLRSTSPTKYRRTKERCAYASLSFDQVLSQCCTHKAPELLLETDNFDPILIGPL